MQGAEGEGYLVSDLNFLSAAQGHLRTKEGEGCEHHNNNNDKEPNN